MTGADVDAYVVELRAQHRDSAYTLWQGRGRKRRLVARAESVAEARELAHQHAPCAVWSTDGSEPVLVTSRVTPKSGAPYTWEHRGEWAWQTLQRDCATLRALAHGAEVQLPPHRASRAAKWLRLGSAVWFGEIRSVGPAVPGIRVVRGRVRLSPPVSP